MSKKSAKTAETAVEETQNGGSDLDSLRDMLFGNQVRTTTRRLDDIEARAESNYNELTDLINKKADSLSGASSEQVTAVRQALTERIDKNYQTLDQSIQKLTADVQAQFQALKKELTDHMQKLNAEQKERSRTVQNEARQQNDDLRQEVLTLTAWLDDKKTSRQDLGLLLAEVAQRLQEKDLPTVSDSEKSA